MPSAVYARPAMPRPQPASVLALRVELDGIRPAIWRRLLVPGGVHLGQLHAIFQAAMGWSDAHLHQFEIGGRQYGPADEDADDDEIDEATVTVIGALEALHRFRYVYDFGDNWQHAITVEGVTRSPLSLRFAVCLDGKNACPPDDCGGVYGYAAMLDALADPSHDEHRTYREWLGEEFDPTGFDLAAANAALQRLA